MDQKGPLLIKEAKKLSHGQQFFGKFLILEKNHRRTKDGKEIYNLRMGDTSGEIDAIVWESCPVAGKLETGAVIAMLGDMGSFNGKIQINAKKVKVQEDEDPLHYVRQPGVPLATLQQKLDEMLAVIDDPYLQLLMESIFTPDFKERFYKGTAAKRIHHNYNGGLLEHTLSVAELCNETADHYPHLNRELLLCGALLHDIGKLDEYEVKVTPQYTVEGRLIGHIVIGSEFISKHIAKLRLQGLDFPEELEWMLKHMILSHHGNLEYGSPVIPLFPEAFVLHEMDDLDAKMFIFSNKIEEHDGEEELFTNYDSFFGQQFFTYRYQSQGKIEK